MVHRRNAAAAGRQFDVRGATGLVVTAGTDVTVRVIGDLDVAAANDMAAQTLPLLEPKSGLTMAVDLMGSNLIDPAPARSGARSVPEHHATSARGAHPRRLPELSHERQADGQA
jgi:hypothetical protein